MLFHVFSWDMLIPPGYELYDLKNGDFFTAFSVKFVENEFPTKDMFSELEELLAWKRRV